MLVKVKITSDSFIFGTHKMPRGSILEVVPPIARVIEKNGEGVIVKEDPIKEVKTKPTPPKKKSTYKRRDVRAESK